MNSWSVRRKRIVLAIVLFAIVILVGVPLFFLFYQKPTCFDGVKNGDEVGVDCGGSCQRLCTIESLPIITRGDVRVLEIASSTYVVAGLFENPNVDAEIYRAGYSIKLYDSNGTLPIKTIEGSTFVPKGSEFAIFEGPFFAEAGAMPRRALIDWSEDSLDWKKNQVQYPDISVSDISLSRTESSPRVEANIKNKSLSAAVNIDLTAIISDENGNIFAASKTFIERLSAGEESQAIFSWPRPFEGRPVDIKILTRIFPDRSFIK